MALPALSVNVVVPLVVRDVGLHVAVTPVGRLEALKVTADANPPAIVRVTVSLTLAPPCVAVIDVGDADSEKFRTVKATVVVRVKLPFVPVIVTVEDPPAAADVVVIVKMLVPLAERVVGSSVALVPAGSPVTLSDVDPVRSLVAVSVTVAVPFAPATMDTEPGEAASENPAVCTSVADVDCTRLPDVPVIVKG